jgi:serine/threonine protein kinase
MQALKLIQRHCPQALHTIPKIEKEIGGGSDGQCFSIVGETKKVIKLSVIYDHPAREITTYNDVAKVLERLISTPTDAYVRVYEHGLFGSYSCKASDWYKDEQDFVIYYYIMEKLEQISSNEFKIFHSILSHEDRKIIKNFPIIKIREMLVGLNRGLDFDVERVILFCDKIKCAPIINDDINPRNIMVNVIGDYKLVDLDRCRLVDKKVLSQV